MSQKDLSKYDFIFLLDKSGSMGTRDCGNKTRWEAAREATVALARKCAEYDKDGITVIPFAGDLKVYDNITGGDAKVDQIFAENEPNGSTDTARVFDYVFNKYLKGKREKPIIIICATDGEASNPQALTNSIINATKQITTEDEIGISFIQIGKDKNASAFLKKLDDDLVKQGAKFDIVDTKTMEEMENMRLDEVLIAALTD